MTTDRCSHGELMTDPCAACDGYTKAEDSASAPVPAGGTPGGLAREKVEPSPEPVNPAAQGAAPEPHRDYSGRTCTTGLLHDHSEGAAPLDTLDDLIEAERNSSDRQAVFDAMAEAQDAQGAAPLTEAVRRFLDTAYPNNGEGRTDRLVWQVPESAFGPLREAIEGAAPRAEGLREVVWSVMHAYSCDELPAHDWREHLPWDDEQDEADSIVLADALIEALIGAAPRAEPTFVATFRDESEER